MPEHKPDCRKCRTPHPIIDLSDEGLCVTCHDREAGGHQLSPGAIASQKCRDKIKKAKKRVGAKLERRD